VHLVRITYQIITMHGTINIKFVFDSIELFYGAEFAFIMI
jgi:hypothetical protein